LEGPETIPPSSVDLARRLEAVESEVEDLQRSVQLLQEENQFLQRLLEDHSARPAIPPPSNPT
jgi:hypothetical protein